MFIHHQDFSPDLLTLIGAAEQAVRRVAPLFPLDRAVAVNPFHGMIDEPIATAAARLERVAGIRIFPSRHFHRAQVDAGEILPADIKAALAEVAPDLGLSGADILAELYTEAPSPVAAPTVAELAAEASGTDWPALVSERIGAWAQGHFDEGQALWSVPGQGSAWTAWRAWAMRDLTPEIHGLAGFSGMVAETQQNHWRALGDACLALGIDHDAAPSVFHRLLCELGGWAGLGRYRLWQAELRDERDATLTELLTIRLVWEQALHAASAHRIAPDWEATLKVHRRPVAPGREHLVDAALLRAGEIASARRLHARLTRRSDRATPEASCEAQLVFCIDVRSERIRRALETVSPDLRTIGAAGFFGLPIALRKGAGDEPEARCPAILAPSLKADDHDPEEAQKRIRGRLGRAVMRFSRAAVSSFAYVEAAGPLRLGSLVGASLSRAGRAAAHGPTPRLTLDPLDPAALDAAEGALRAMGLVADFAPIVAFVGHAARVTNDPQSALLQCGACGGHDGAVNARALAQLLNETTIRRGLAERGISIPDATTFLAGLHDTTGDAVTLFAEDRAANAYDPRVTRLAGLLEEAARLVRAEREPLFVDAASPGALGERGGDWSQTRAEWGLANCHWFIAAPRHLTRGLKLEGQAFLHDYDPAKDTDGSWLSDILAGPVLVAAWINLQYYGARVSPEAYGGGNKLLQNVFGGVGVLDGVTGRLKGGPSEQSLRDGAREMHMPVRLAVRVAASETDLQEALSRTPILRKMALNGWIDLRPLAATQRA